MPTTTLRNLAYRCALPFLSPSPKGQMSHQPDGHALNIYAYEHILTRHHVFGASLLLRNGADYAQVHTSTTNPVHIATDSTLYRVASITKMATALVVLRLVDVQAFTLDDYVADHLPEGQRSPALREITLRQLLSHTSGLCDTPAYDKALRDGQTIHEVLSSDGVRTAEPGQRMIYCNFGFGLLGCMIEHATDQSIAEAFSQRLFKPLNMLATMDASTLQADQIMPVTRILPYHKGQDVTITALGRKPLRTPDPLRHFGHTAGAMYTNARSLSAMLDLVANDGAVDGTQLISPGLIQQMKTQHSFTGNASSPIRRYGLGLVILDRPDLSGKKLFGHQGFAYGCVDGAFYEEETRRQMIFLNGGCSEAREGRLGLCNKELLIWALQKEMPSWK